MSCPNTNLEEWKLLVASRGEDVAYALWDLHDGNVPESESRESIVKSGLKATNILQSPKADQFFNAVAKNKITGDFFWKKMQADLGIPKDQLEILKLFNTQDRGELISSLLANYSYAVEINTAKTREAIDDEYRYYEENSKYYRDGPYDGKEEITKEEFERNNYKKDKNSNYYYNLTVPGGTNYTENEIATPAITPSIKGHAQFSTDNGIGWFRSDEQGESTPITSVENIPITKFTLGSTGMSYEKYKGNWYAELETDAVDAGYGNPEKDSTILNAFNEFANISGEGSKTRRILEVQSDWGQKQRKSSEPDINVNYDIQQIINDLQKSGDLKIDCN